MTAAEPHAHAALERALDLRYGGEMSMHLHHAADLFEAAGREDYAKAIRADAMDGMSDARSIAVSEACWSRGNALEQNWR